MMIFLVLGVVTSLAVLCAAAVSLVLLVQLLGQVVEASPDMQNIDSLELNSVNFSRYESGKTVTGVTTATWSSVVLGLCSLILLAISLHAQTVTVRTLDEYLDLVINDGIGDWPNLTSHRRTFRPADQMTVGQVIVFVGLIEITLMDYLPGHDQSAPHAWAMVWSGALVIGAGLISIFYNKMTYSRKLGIISSTVEMCALLSCAIATVLTTLNLAKDAQQLKSQVKESHESPIISNLATMICAEAISDCLSIVGIVFCIGILFRQMARSCDCAGDEESGDKATRRAATIAGSRTGSVSDGRRNSRNTMSTWRPSHETEMYVVGAGITVEQASTGVAASSQHDR